MIVKKFGEDFFSSGGALTLPVEAVSESDVSHGEHSRKHKSGWTISGKVCEDYYVWVNNFYATHPEYGRVFGDFEDEVYADTEEGFQHFYKNHPPEAWDYMYI